MKRTLRKISAPAHSVLVEILSNPDLVEHLSCVRELAVYDSGHAELGKNEKEALHSVRSLERKLRQMKRRDWRYIRKLIRKETV